ncbi:4'-phosphopantetheinyl transferase superfamily protein [Microbacterium sp. VKM Ac-2923]|uniref:4'-phosphopantetheinyl transferase family protein n=1 Tax=Microbacterium sp. VKM Ac-2923 TaxID=2929476 RepID=UPI001FB3B6C8|nr:4'-phosphopantetheinyl transferase superfamily protein [Microbacterium sp. VKM Ac-2923]MCJ1708523.1 4'-phosphopantetheinyl transferase superfamily protein [Microbacterium sp. VKM Ac-2923]
MTGFAALLPAGVIVEETRVEAAVDALFPAEYAAVAGAVASRVAEFTTGRACAHRALARLGVAAVPIVPGPHREPVWPEGIVGSITHCAGLRAAAVARAGDMRSLGIDAETHEPLPENTLDIVAVAAELPRLAALQVAVPNIAWDRVLFSAKESIYKTWFPLAGRWLDFTECDLTIERDGTFRGDLLVPGPVVGARELGHIAGRWAIDGEHILTAAWVAG